MEVMEDGNLMDKVHILIQRDLEYYKNKHSILQETVCPGVAGGRLDFPRNASFAAVKLALWWEDEYVAGFRKPSGLIPKLVRPIVGDSASSEVNAPIVKKSDPDKFISLTAKSSDQLLEHLHVLTQEALDHADLTVLMGTLGAATLLKNCLWFYIQLCTDASKIITPLQTSYKQYQEMGEALAERMLDMHCRLISLYILQDAESLDWENTKPFFESERGSYVIQMWWLYMKGTKQDLWNSVPPKMAQKVLAGMLNESLTILAVRYTQSFPSESRSKLLVVDISNLLLCIAQLLPSICNSADEVIGLVINSQSKTLRDIHAKCQELFICLTLRGTPLHVLYKVFRKGIDSVEIFKSRNAGPSPWIIFGLPHIFPEYPKGVAKLNDLPDNSAIGLEIFVMLAQPQPNWALLMKVLGMRDGKVLSILFGLAMKTGSTNPLNTSRPSMKLAKCDGFLCVEDGSCRSTDSESPFCSQQNYYDLVVALTHILLSIGNNSDFSSILLSFIEDSKDWSQCFDRRQVWNLNQPPWYKAILSLVNPILKPIIPTVISAVQTGASMYQAMTIVLACFIQLWDCVDSAVPRIAFLLQDLLPVDVAPLGKSALLQILIGALYSQLLCKAEKHKKDVKFAEGTKEDSSSAINIPLKKQVTVEHRNSICSFDGTNSSTEAVALAVAEALCSIDENNKHTEEIDDLLEQAKQGIEVDHLQSEGCKRVEQSLQMSEVLVSDLLMTPEGKRSLKIVYHFIICNHEWLLQALGVSEESKPFEPNRAMPTSKQLLHTMFHVGYRPFDQLLTGKWQPDWSSLFHIPMGLSADRIWNQVSMRWEFKDINTSALSAQDARVVANLTNLLKQI